MPRRVFITVAEVSGDLHAAQLIRRLRAVEPDLIVEGFGGPAMASAGATIHQETVSGAAMTWRGALRALEVIRLLRWTARHFAEHRPDLQICVDSSGMNLHFARYARSLKIPVLYYIAPQLWASREGRMKKLARAVDRLACILPFEEPYFRAHGIDARFVGHPLFDELPGDRRGATIAPTVPERPVVGLLAGSRRSEAAQNFPGLLDVASRILSAIPGSSFLTPTTPATTPVVTGMANVWRDDHPGVGLEQKEGGFDEMVPRCDLCITVSGTATLHVASFLVPMIVVYRVNPMVWHGIGRWLVHTRTFALVNLLAQGAAPTRGQASALHIVPEFVPWNGSGEAVATLAIDLLTHPQKRLAQQQRLRGLVDSLDRPGASDNVAGIAIEMMDSRPTSTMKTPGEAAMLRGKNLH